MVIVLHCGLGYDRHVKGKRGESTMAVARVSEIVASSADSIEGAIQEGLKRATKTIRGITGFEVMRVQGKVDKGKLK